MKNENRIVAVGKIERDYHQHRYGLPQNGRQAGGDGEGHSLWHFLEKGEIYMCECGDYFEVVSLLGYDYDIEWRKLSKWEVKRRKKKGEIK